MKSHLRNEDLKRSNQVYFGKISRIQEENEADKSKLQSEIKQLRFTLEDAKAEIESINKKFKESEVYLKSEAMKTKKVSDELVIYKEKVNMLERRLRTQSTSGANSGAASPRTNVSMSSAAPEPSIQPQLPNLGPKQVSGVLTSHNPLKSSGQNISRGAQLSGPDTPLLRKTSSSQQELPSSETTDPSATQATKKSANNLQKQVESLEFEKGELEKKVLSYNSLLMRKEAECVEFRRAFEEKAEQTAHLQEELRKLTVSSKSLNEKRLLGLKEIQKLRDKLETLKAQSALNESLNSSFNMSLNGSFDLTNRDKAKLADVLQM